MAETPPALPSGGTVLAVDDQHENLALLEEILTEEGFAVRLAADGQEALDAVSEKIPDCILLDIMMPRLDGFGVLQRLKGRRDTHFVPILMLTALTGVRDKVRAYELGADDFLNKPVNPAELVVRVRSLVRIKRLRDELDTFESIIVSMVEALESKDPAAAGHSQRVASTAPATRTACQAPTCPSAPASSASPTPTTRSPRPGPTAAPTPRGRPSSCSRRRPTRAAGTAQCLPRC